MTERFPRSSGASPQEHASTTGSPSAGQPDLVTIDLDGRLAGRLADLADGRVLVIDYLVTRPSWAMPEAELSVRLQRAAPLGSVRIAVLEGVACVADPRLVAVLRAAGGTLRPVAGAVLGQLELDLERPLAWLDFVASAAARRP